MRKSLFVFIVIVTFVLSCTKDRMPSLIELDNLLEESIISASPDGTKEYYILPEDGDFLSIPEDPRNPLTPEKVALGKMLFFETGLALDAVKESGIGTYSCASCHIPEAGFKPGSFQGIADGGSGFGVNGENRVKDGDYNENELDVQSARPLSLVNVAYVTNTFWNGQFGSKGANVGTENVWGLREDTDLNHLGFEAIETQNFIGVVTHRLNSNKEVLDDLGYTSMFDEVFPEIDVEERYNIQTVSLALSAYIRSIISDKAPFQDWLKGNKNALDFNMKQGAILFFGKAQCYQCHYEQNLGSSEFHAIGVNDMDQTLSYNTSPNDRRNLGRGGFTLVEEDNFKFKVPGLYNISDTEFYFHGASKENLEDVIEYFDKAIAENPRVSQELLSEKFGPLSLSEEEKANLVYFLEEGLRDPDLIRYKPDSILSGNCFPNNDLQSQIDLGCQ